MKLRSLLRLGWGAVYVFLAMRFDDIIVRMEAQLSRKRTVRRVGEGKVLYGDMGNSPQRTCYLIFAV